MVLVDDLLTTTPLLKTLVELRQGDRATARTAGGMIARALRFSDRVEGTRVVMQIR
jgi:hypothetical protein